MIKLPLTIALPIAALAIALCSCKESEIRVYRVEKELNTNLTTSATSDSVNEGDTQLIWTTPIEWKILQRTALSKNRYSHENQFGEVSITVFALPGAAANFPQNVNLWAKEMGIPPFTPKKATQLAKAVRYSNLPATEIQISNLAANLTTFAVAIPQTHKVWYFKMNGGIKAVEDEMERFNALLQSFKVISSRPIDGNIDETPTMHDIIIDTPEGWIENEKNPLRLASYRIERAGIEPADFSISRFHQSQNNLAANINRWRRQLGLNSWTKQKTEQRTRTINTEQYSFKTFDLKAKTAAEKEQTNERMFIAILEHEQNIFVFKLKGDALLLDTQRRNYLELLETVQVSDQLPLKDQTRL